MGSSISPFLRGDIRISFGQFLGQSRIILPFENLPDIFLSAYCFVHEVSTGSNSTGYKCLKKCGSTQSCSARDLLSDRPAYMGYNISPRSGQFGRMEGHGCWKCAALTGAAITAGIEPATD